MDPHLRQQFDLLLLGATERYVERLQHRCGGVSEGLARLREDPEGSGVWLTEFAGQVMQDHLLDNAAGACFVLRNVPRHELPAVGAGRVEERLISMATRALADLLRRKAEEALERAASFEPTEVA